jgi:hypothetical protein
MGKPAARDIGRRYGDDAPAASARPKGTVRELGTAAIQAADGSPNIAQQII